MTAGSNFDTFSPSPSSLSLCNISTQSWSLFFFLLFLLLFLLPQIHIHECMNPPMQVHDARYKVMLQVLSSSQSAVLSVCRNFTQATEAVNAVNDTTGKRKKGQWRKKKEKHKEPKLLQLDLSPKCQRRFSDGECEDDLKHHLVQKKRVCISSCVDLASGSWNVVARERRHRWNDGLDEFVSSLSFMLYWIWGHSTHTHTHITWSHFGNCFSCPVFAFFAVASVDWAKRIWLRSIRRRGRGTRVTE